MIEYPFINLYTVVGYEEETVIDSKRIDFFDTATISVYADSEQEALNKAKNLVKKKYYRIMGVREEIDTIRANYLNVKEQTGIQKQLVDAFKKDWEK